MLLINDGILKAMLPFDKKLTDFEQMVNIYQNGEKSKFRPFGPLERLAK